MKTHSWVGRFAALLCFAATLHLNLARAQDPPKAAETTPTARATAKGGSALAYDLVIDEDHQVVLHNGKRVESTLDHVVGALREIWPEANIVLAPEVSKVFVGDLKLHSTRELGEALEALRVASGYRFDWRKGLPNAGRAGTDPATGLPIAATGGESSLYVLDLGINSQGNPLERARRMVEVFNLSGFLDHFPSQDIDHINRTLNEIQKTVIETLESLKGGGLSESDGPHLRFHEGTRLLIVTGPPDAIEVASKVVTALTGQPSGGESVLLGDANQRAAEARYRRYGPRPGAPAPGQAAPNNPPAGSTFTERIKSTRKDGQAGPDDPSSAPANPAPPPR